MASQPRGSAPSSEPPRRPGPRRFACRAAAVDLFTRAAIGIGLVASLACGPPRAEETVSIPGNLPFYQVEIDDSAFADEVLRRYLTDRVGISFTHQRFSYENVIEILAATRAGNRQQEDDRPFLARVTPYVFVVAKTLGAQLEVLATYQGRTTNGTTYRSYFVVRRDDLADPTKPTLEDLENFLLRRTLEDDPALFVYKSKFSTSGYFVPALFFREREIYSVARVAGKHAAIRSQEVGGGSTDLVLRVARGEADLAAVWDGPKAKFDRGGELYREFGGELAFIELETIIPNDLLVTSANLPEEVKQPLRQAIGEMTEANLTSFVGEDERKADLGDFRYWLDFDATDSEAGAGARKARAALSGLCALTRRRPPRVVVDVWPGSGAEKKVGRTELAAMLEATRQAIRLSSTELTLFDGEIHDQADLRWELTPLHDEAVLLESFFTSVEGVAPQEFRISHKGGDGSYKDLTQRIGDRIHSRLHRIRYLWPYQEDLTVIRDVAFDLPQSSPVKIQRIRWLDPEANDFQRSGVLEARVADSDYSTFRLELQEAGGDLAHAADPLSDVAYRVVLLRTSRQGPLLMVFTGVYVVLMLAAALFAGLDLRRRVALTAEADRKPPTLALVTG